MASRTERSIAAAQAKHYFVLTFLWTWTFWWIAALSGAEFPELPALILYALGGVGPALAASLLGTVATPESV